MKRMPGVWRFCCLQENSSSDKPECGLTTTEFRKVCYWLLMLLLLELTEEEIDYYVQKYKPMDKAGSMASGMDWFCGEEGITGSYFNVMGLPITALV